MSRAVGERICGRWEVRGLLGERPLGTLYRAFDVETEVEVALRLVAPALLPDEVSRQSFLQRLGRARSFSHPNLVRLYDLAIDAEAGRTDAGQVVVAVQWAPGELLSSRLKRGRLSPSEARPILRQVVAATAHVHQLGLVLGDLRAGTVVGLGPALKVSSIGLGPALPRGRYLEAMRGTAAWRRLAPELRSGGPIDPRADVWSLAVLAVEMLTGTEPTRPLAIGRAPAALLPVLERALAEDPIVRHPTIEALGGELDRVLGGGEARPRRNSRPTLDLSGDSTVPTPRIDEDEPTSPSNEEATRQVSEEELRRLKGAEVTRQVPEAELFPLRVQSSETREIDADMVVRPEEGEDGEEELSLEVVRAEDGTWRSPVPPARPTPLPMPTLPPSRAAPPERPAPTQSQAQSDPFEAKTDQVILLEPDHAKTTEVPRLEPEIPRPPPPLPPERSVPPSLPRASDAPEGTPLPPPSPAPPSHPPAADEFGDEHMETNRVDKLPPRELFPPPAPARAPAPRKPARTDEGPGNDLPPRARELTVPDRLAVRRPTPPALPSIQVELPPDESEPPTTSRPLPPPRVEPLARAARPAAPKRGGLGLFTMLFVGALIAAAIGFGVVRQMQRFRQDRDRAEKSALADQLNARAEALRRGELPQPGSGLTSAPTRAPAPKPEAPPAAADLATAPEPIVTHPMLAPPEGPCPLGANLVSAGRGMTRYCVDLYEYPGGRTIPRTNVSFDEAEKLCVSRGERLCTDVEFERACRGHGQSSYPYGQAYNPVRCNTGGGEIAPAGSFKDCRSAVGAYDMSGNVAEWVTTGAAHLPAQKGGSAHLGNPFARCSHTLKSVNPAGGPLVGFRCCADPR